PIVGTAVQPRPRAARAPAGPVSGHGGDSHPAKRPQSVEGAPRRRGRGAPRKRPRDGQEANPYRGTIRRPGRKSLLRCARPRPHRGPPCGATGRSLRRRGLRLGRGSPPLAEPAFGPSLRAGSRQRTRPARQSMTGDESAWLDAAPWGITPRVADRLRATAAEVAREWGVPLSQRIVGGRFSFVAFAGDDAVLKVVPIEDDEADHEADALALLAGDGAVRLLRHPIGHMPTREGVEQWIGAFADAGLDANLLRKWAIVRGTYQGLPLSRGLTTETSPQLRVVRALLERAGPRPFRHRGHPGLAQTPVVR